MTVAARLTASDIGESGIISSSLSTLEHAGVVNQTLRWEANPSRGSCWHTKKPSLAPFSLPGFIVCRSRHLYATSMYTFLVSA